MRHVHVDRRADLRHNLLILVGVVSYLACLGMLLAEGETQRILTVIAIAIGPNLILYAFIVRKGRSIEEAYRFGYDLGYEAGARDAQRDNVVHLRRRDLA